MFKAVDVEKEVPRGMLTQEDDVEIHALAARGWNKSAIARHTGRDRKTIAKYLKAGGPPRRERAPSCLAPFRSYIEASSSSSVTAGRCGSSMNLASM